MLKNKRGQKLKDMDIPEQEWIQMLYLTCDGIMRKLDLARRFINVDKDISAGLYNGSNNTNIVLYNTNSKRHP